MVTLKPSTAPLSSAFLFYSPSCWRPNSGQSDGGRSLSNQPPHLLKQNKQTMLSVLGFLTQEIPIHVCAPLVQRAQGK